MLPYKRTDLGLAEIHTRNSRLPSRARTLLLLLESDDIHHLNHQVKRKIVTQDNVDILLQAGLIIKVDQPAQLSDQLSNRSTLSQKNPSTSKPLSTQTNAVEASVTLDAGALDKVSHESIKLNLEPLSNDAEPLPSAYPPLAPLNTIDAIKSSMIVTLTQYGGLMAKRLIGDIQNSHSIAELRLHQRNWLTLLFETKIPKADLNAQLQLINNSITALSLSHAG